MLAMHLSNHLGRHRYTVNCHALAVHIAEIAYLSIGNWIFNDQFARR
jgi:hypothetical protein